MQYYVLNTLFWGICRLWDAHASRDGLYLLWELVFSLIWVWRLTLLLIYFVWRKLPAVRLHDCVFINGLFVQLTTWLNHLFECLPLPFQKGVPGCTLPGKRVPGKKWHSIAPRQVPLDESLIVSFTYAFRKSDVTLCLQKASDILCNSFFCFLLKTFRQATKHQTFDNETTRVVYFLLSSEK